MAASYSRDAYHEFLTLEFNLLQTTSDSGQLFSILLEFFLALEPVIEGLRESDARLAREIGLDDMHKQIVPYEVPRVDAIRDIDTLMTAANDAYNLGVALRFKPAV